MAEKKENIIKEVFDIGMNEMKDMAEVSDACGQFRQLLIEQLTRELMMEQDTEPPKDFKNLDTVTIGVCPGDGIGTIISIEAERVLRHLLADEIESGKIVIKDIEGLTIENRLEKQQAVPDDVLAESEVARISEGRGLEVFGVVHLENREVGAAVKADNARVVFLAVGCPIAVAREGTALEPVVEHTREVGLAVFIVILTFL